MNDLVERLREEPYPYEKRHGLGITAMEAWHKTACEAADEIERLTAENKHVTLLYNASLKSQDKQQAEIKRLRAALERIVNQPWNAGRGGWAQKVAREALR